MASRRFFNQNGNNSNHNSSNGSNSASNGAKSNNASSVNKSENSASTATATAIQSSNTAPITISKSGSETSQNNSQNFGKSNKSSDFFYRSFKNVNELKNKNNQKSIAQGKTPSWIQQIKSKSQSDISRTKANKSQQQEPSVDSSKYQPVVNTSVKSNLFSQSFTIDGPSDRNDAAGASNAAAQFIPHSEPYASNTKLLTNSDGTDELTTPITSTDTSVAPQLTSFKPAKSSSEAADDSASSSFSDNLARNLPPNSTKPTNSENSNRYSKVLNSIIENEARGSSNATAESDPVVLHDDDLDNSSNSTSSSSSDSNLDKLTKNSGSEASGDKQQQQQSEMPILPYFSRSSSSAAANNKKNRDKDASASMSDVEVLTVNKEALNETLIKNDENINNVNIQIEMMINRIENISGAEDANMINELAEKVNDIGRFNEELIAEVNGQRDNRVKSKHYDQKKNWEQLKFIDDYNLALGKQLELLEEQKIQIDQLGKNLYNVYTIRSNQRQQQQQYQSQFANHHHHPQFRPPSFHPQHPHAHPHAQAYAGFGAGAQGPFAGPYPGQAFYYTPPSAAGFAPQMPPHTPQPPQTPHTPHTPGYYGTGQPYYSSQGQYPPQQQQQTTLYYDPLTGQYFYQSNGMQQPAMHPQQPHMPPPHAHPQQQYYYPNNPFKNNRYSGMYQQKAKMEEEKNDVIITEVASDDEDEEFRSKKAQDKDYVDAISLNGDDDDEIVTSKSDAKKA